MGCSGSTDVPTQASKTTTYTWNKGYSLFWKLKLMDEEAAAKLV
jgi:hypothetical protein